MLIDWFTITAQVVNFLVLVYLLKRFLYGPVIRAMDERDKKIGLRLEDAQRMKQEAQLEMENFQRQNRELDAQRQALLSEMKLEAEGYRKGLMDEARKQVDAMRANWFEAIHREKDAFLQDLRQRAGKQTCAIARRALRDLADVDLEHHIIRVFIERLRAIDEEELGALKESIRKSGGRIHLHSAFEIPQEMAQQIIEVLKNHGSDDVDLRFEISSEIVCGIELKVHGRKIAWSLEDYLETLEAHLLSTLEGKEGKLF